MMTATTMRGLCSSGENACACARLRGGAAAARGVCVLASKDMKVWKSARLAVLRERQAALLGKKNSSCSVELGTWREDGQGEKIVHAVAVLAPRGNANRGKR